jgi:hypothetical protein
MTLLRKILIVQILLLGATLAMGAALKGGLIEEARLLHRSFATLGGIAAIATTIAAFRGAQTKSVKMLSILTLILAFGAAVGGKLAASGVSYNLSYGAMAGSGTLALILSIVLLFKAR